MSTALLLTLIGATLTFAGAMFGAFKEKADPNSKDAKRKRVFKIIAVFVFIASFFTTCISSVKSERDKAGAEKGKALDRQQITSLNQSITTLQNVNKTQHEQDLAELGKVNSQLSDLKTGIATAELRKKMGILQDELDKYLNANPKVELESGLWTSQQDPLKSQIYIPVDGTKTKFVIGLRNSTQIYAKNVELWVTICTECKFQSEPAGSMMLPENGPQIRYWHDINLASNISYNASIEVEVPRPYTDMAARVRYRCENCVVAQDKIVFMSLGRTGLPRLQAPAKKIPDKPARKP